MRQAFPWLYQLSVGTIAVRLLLALAIGGIVGMDRGRKGRPAGLKTHSLVCVGAALVMMLGQFVHQEFGSGDVARMGAQVISGIGFLGAGTILVTRNNQVRGLTTAAGVWACSCMGLACGIGFYEGALLTCLVLMVVLWLLAPLDDYLHSHAACLNAYIELSKVGQVGQLIALLHRHDIKISNIEMKKPRVSNEAGAAVLATVSLGKKRDHTEFFEILGSMEGISYMEEV